MAISFNALPALSSGDGSSIPYLPWRGGGGATSTPTASPAVNTAPVAQSSAFSSLIAQLSTPTQAAALAQYQEDPRLTAMLADLMARAQQSDADISSQANGAYEAQRKVADQQIDRQQTRSLAANGVLPTGGLAAQYRTELASPVYDRLNAQRAQTELDLRNQRDGVKQGVTSTLSGLDSNKNQFTLSQLSAQQQAEAQRQQLLAQSQYQQASLSQQAQLASQQLAADQARAQAQQAMSQAELDYRRQSDAQSLAFQREQAQLQNQRYYSGGGTSGGAGGSSPGGGTFSTLGSGSVFGADDAAAMRGAYERNIANDPNTHPQSAEYWAARNPARPTTSNTNAASSGGWGGGSATGGGGMAGSGLSMTGYGSAPTSSFYTAPASGSNFTPPSSMFNWGA